MSYVFNDVFKKVEDVPARSVVLIFKGRTLQDQVAVFKVSADVDSYTPRVKICWNCLRYGYIRN